MATISDIDDWIDQLQAQGNFVSCSSGTTGKSAMLIASAKDMDWSRIDTVNVFAWGSGVEPKQDRKLIGCAPVATVPKNQIIGEAQYAAFANPEWERWTYPVPPIHAHITRRAAESGDVRPMAMDMKEEIEALMFMDDEFGVWGKTDGKGLVIRSDAPVDFQPINKTANVVRVDSLDDAIKWINVATQTVGFYPFDRMSAYRDRLAAGGAQRVVHLGEAGPSTIGNPHDAMYPLHRFVHWTVHEDGVGEGAPAIMPAVGLT